MAERQPLPTPDFGNMVIYTLTGQDSDRHAGEPRPAVIVKDHGDGIVNLIVFVDGLNDVADGSLMLHRMLVHHGFALERGAWHPRDQIG